jgi:hypothetical protein
MDPNQKNAVTGEYPLIYAWKQKKYRSVITLLENSQIECAQKDENGQTILGLAINAIYAVGKDPVLMK